MIELFVIIGLSRALRKKADTYGIKPGGYIAAFVAGWIILEIIGIIIAVASENIIIALPLIYGGGIGIYFLVRMFLIKAGEDFVMGTDSGSNYDSDSRNPQEEKGQEDFF